MITVYTDGSSLGNPGRGGWGALIKFDNGEFIELSGGYRYTTNNRMELLAIIEALSYLKKNSRHKSDSIMILTDSQLISNSINKKWLEKWSNTNWKKSDGSLVLNIDLWKKLLLLLEDMQVSFNWIAGHSGIAGNERCDTLCKLAAENAIHEDTEYLNSINQSLFDGDSANTNITTTESNSNSKSTKDKMELISTSYCGKYKIYLTDSKVRILGISGDSIEFPRDKFSKKLFL